MQGYIKRWNPDRFFGFIQGEAVKGGGEEDYFFHGRDYRGDTSLIALHQPVSFDVQPGEPCKRAVCVRRE